eukprot:CAMPEP_0171456240 /NCGR_PEP_ID=MMETSP0945-20130129/2805_1 /TAXON_ID=109269 /ORGANISM="Vaucheria litorea, Strain CCMP2940" /LENGTH=399 /DNA_ID=CAMNT_0011981623 /DNA_START=201 /DNA_END=1400 /DNA_ORIENTATION=-
MTEVVQPNGVFVKFKGMPITGEDVKKVFEGFGPLAPKTTFDDKRGFAKIYYGDEETTLKAVGGDGTAVVGGETVPVERLNPAPSKATELAKDSTSIYVGGLSGDVEKPALKEFFAQFGEVKSLLLKKHKQRKEGVTHVFLTFVEKAAAEKAIAASESGPLKFGDTELVVEWKKSRQPEKKDTKRQVDGEGNDQQEKAKGDRAKKERPKPKKVYVSNFKLDLTEDDIKKAFESFGTVEGVRIGTRDTLARVEFGSVEVVKSVLESVKASPMELEGSTLTVKPWKSSDKSEDETTALHVSNFGSVEPSEASIRDHFKGFGEVTEVEIRKTRKFAQVELDTPGAAASAVEKGISLPTEGAAELVVEMSAGPRKGGMRRNRRGPRGGGAKGNGKPNAGAAPSE